MKSEYLASDNLIAMSKTTEPNIYIREQFGIYQKLRRYLSWGLMILFIAVPFIRFQERQAILFDIEQQTLQLFSLVLFPQDLFIFSLIFAFAAFALFYITSLYGRVWCGFTCPQTVWMLMFNWIERRVEGSANKSKHLDQAKWSTKKLFIKLVKHLLWLSVSLLTSLVFMSYFVPVERLYTDFLTLNSSSLIVAWVTFFALCTYINAGWIKEKMCQHMCPYSRFQSAMFTEATKLVTYHEHRGESRGKRKRGSKKPNGMGDCVDCNLCVEVCPAGIDIRDGLQYECINCGLCIDACDQTMEKFGYKKGLINFSKENEVGRKQHISYLVVLLLLLTSMGVWAATWQSMEVNIIRDRNTLYRINNQGQTENTYVVKIRNKSLNVQNVSITSHMPTIIALDKKYNVAIGPRELVVIPLSAILKDESVSKVQKITLTVASDLSDDIIEKQVSFYSENTNG